MAKRTLISVVEDDQPFRESMRKLMTVLGYTVEAFSSAAEFLKSPLVTETACLVTDVQMPGMSGRRAPQTSRRYGPRDPDHSRHRLSG